MSTLIPSRVETWLAPTNVLLLSNAFSYTFCPRSTVLSQLDLHQLFERRQKTLSFVPSGQNGIQLAGRLGPINRAMVCPAIILEPLQPQMSILAEILPGMFSEISDCRLRILVNLTTKVGSTLWSLLVSKRHECKSHLSYSQLELTFASSPKPQF